MKWYEKFILIPIIAIASVLLMVLWPAPLRIHADEYLIVLQQYTKQPPTLDIIFNPTGTHVDSKGYLKVRLDFYPNEGQASYEQSLVEIPIYPPEGYPGKIDKNGWIVDEEDYAKWRESLPTETILTPCLTHFVTVYPDITKGNLETYITNTFHKEVTDTIDNIVVQDNSSHLLSPYMRDKTVLSAIKVFIGDVEDIKDNVNNRLSELAVVGDGTLPDVALILPESIDVGGDAIPRPSYTYTDYTYVDKNNPSNGTGTIDTIDFIAEDNLSDFRVGTFYNVSGSTYKCREGSGNLGAFSSGLRQVTGLSLDIVTDDLIGSFCDVASSSHPLERDTTGYAGILYSGTGNYCETDAQTTYSTAAGDAISLYGTGTESGTPDISNNPPSKAFGTVAASASYWSNGSEPSWPLTDGDAYFTITNDSAIAIDITIESTDFDGGGGWNLVTTSPGAGEARMLAYKEGDGSTDNITVLNTPTLFISSLAASADIDWELRLDVPTVSDQFQHSATITLEASAS